MTHSLKKTFLRTNNELLSSFFEEKKGFLTKEELKECLKIAWGNCTNEYSRRESVFPEPEEFEE